MLVDGKSSVAGEQGWHSASRRRDGPASADELMAKKKEEGREFVKDKRVVYIYHNTVDAIGDDGQDGGKDI